LEENIGSDAKLLATAQPERCTAFSTGCGGSEKWSVYSSGESRV